jgi:hypothetical protein
MTYLLRRGFVAIVGVLVYGCVASACSSGPSAGAPGAAGTSGGSEPAFIHLEITPALSVAIQNRAALPLLNVNVAIKPVTGAALYTTTLPRLEPSEARNLAFGQFRRPDGTPLSTVLGFVRPKEITVTAVDPDGKKHEMTVPWET